MWNTTCVQKRLHSGKNMLRILFWNLCKPYFSLKQLLPHLSAPASGMMIDQRFQRVRLSAKSCRRHVSLSQTQKDGWKPPRCSRCQHATKMSPTTIRVPFLGSRNVPKCIKLQEGCQKEVNVPDWLVEGSVPNKVLQDWSVQFHSQDWNGLLLVSLAQLFATVCNCELRPQEETLFGTSQSFQLHVIRQLLSGKQNLCSDVPCQRS